jgi:hypothetical protein
MHTWMWLVLLGLGLIKLPIAVLMLWIPFRSDAALASLPPTRSAASDEDDGGSKILSGEAGGGREPRVGGGPHPRAPLGSRGPRRGPHGGAASGRPTSPARVRGARGGATRVRARQ